MASTSFCPQCGTPLPPGQRFCTNCGATIEINANNPTVAASQNPSVPPPGAFPPGQAGLPGSMYPPQTPASGPGYRPNNQPMFTPPPPPPDTYNPYTNSVVSGSQSYAQPTLPERAVPPTPQLGTPQVPAYAQKPKGRGGCVTVSVILLLVLAIGIGGYFVLHTLSAKSNNTNATGTNSTATSGTTTSQGSTPTLSAHAVTTEQLNLQLTYASVVLTLTSAQVASSFPDDTSTTAGSAGVVRVNFRENNTTTDNPDYVEGNSLFLILPGNISTQAGNAQNAVSPSQGVNRLNWIDFPLNAQVALNQLTLRIGKQGENQMDIPLQANADVSKYQDKTNNPNTPFMYGALNMTLKTATLSYSYHDQQASAGNRYVIVTLAAVNPSSDTVYLSPSTYMRVQAGGNSVQPDSSSTFPPVISGNTTGSGVVGFLVPQGTTTFTLVILAQPDTTPATKQVTQTFQIQ